MTPRTVRRVLHAGHAAATLALLATGLLIHWPDLRARTLGGYGRELADLHLWAGWLFLAAPLAAVALAGRALREDAWRRLAPPDRLSWRNAHLLLSLATGAVLAATGLGLWWGEALPLAVWDASLVAHVWATWVLAVALPAHLWMARRALAERLRLALGGEPPALFELAEDEPDEAP